jgi:hypothetical protein
MSDNDSEIQYPESDDNAKCTEERKRTLEYMSRFGRLITQLRNEDEDSLAENGTAILSGVTGAVQIWITGLSMNTRDFAAAARVRFQFDAGAHPSPAEIETAVARSQDQIRCLRSALESANLDTRVHIRNLDEVHTTIKLVGDLLASHERILAIKQGHGQLDSHETALSDPEALKPLSRLLLLFLEHARANNLRRYKGGVYEEVLTDDGMATHAWQVKYEDMTSFIHTVADRSVRPELWTLFTSAAGYKDSVSKHLTDCEDDAFPRLRPDRHYFSFANGIYCTGDDMFYPYGNPELTPDIVSCKFVDLEFNYVAMLPRNKWGTPGIWRDIETPTFEGLLVHQQYPWEVRRWMYVMIGRMLYAVGDRDSWQTATMLKGAAGTGKSTILNVIRLFFADADIGVLSNNIEKKFGLEGLADKLAVICFEVKASFGLDQAELQAMISGERIQVARKGKSQLAIDWKSHLFFAGNELASWVDAAGSMARRFIMFEFDHLIQVTDTSLDKKLRLEMPALLLKCNLAYLAAVDSMQMEDISLSLASPGVLPSYFAKTQARMLGNINTLVHFLEFGDTLSFPAPDAPDAQRQNYFMPLKAFKSLYSAFCEQQMIKAVRPLNSDAYTAPFARKRIRIVEQTGMWVGEKYKGSWLQGVTLLDAEAESAEAEAMFTD